MVQALRKAGYFTGATGKWHNDLDKEFAALMKKIPKDDPKDPQVIAMLGAVQDELRRRLDIYGFDYAEYITDGNLDHFPKALEHHNVEYTVKGAVDFLDQVPDGKPFFLWTAFTVAHGPHEPIDSADLGMTPQGYTEKHFGLMPDRSKFIDKSSKWRNVVKEMVTWMDAGVGVILDKLEAQGKMDNTLIIFQINRIMARHHLMKEVQIYPLSHVGLRRLKQKHKNNTLVDVTDMAATFLDLANAEPVEGAIIDGMSILPVWKGETKELKSAILIESGFAKGVITKDFKYIAIRYNKESLKRGFIPPQSGSIPEHLKKEHLKFFGRKTLSDNLAITSGA